MSETQLALKSSVDRQYDRLIRDPSRGGIQRALGTFPCPYRSDLPHPLPPKNSRRLARFRRNLQAGITYWTERGASLLFVVLAARYDRETGVLKVDLRYSVQRFIQLLRRAGYECEYNQVKEASSSEVKNHSNLVIAFRGAVPTHEQLKDFWAHATYGTSYQVYQRPVYDIGGLARYLSKYLSKQLEEEPAPEAPLDRGYQIATPSRATDYVSRSRGWLPIGAEKEWKRLFIEYAVIWLCDRGFYHTDCKETWDRWLSWLLSQPPPSKIVGRPIVPALDGYIESAEALPA